MPNFILNFLKRIRFVHKRSAFIDVGFEIRAKILL